MSSRVAGIAGQGRRVGGDGFNHVPLTRHQGRSSRVAHSWLALAVVALPHGTLAVSSAFFQALNAPLLNAQEVAERSAYARSKPG